MSRFQWVGVLTWAVQLILMTLDGTDFGFPESRSVENKQVPVGLGI